MDKNQADIRWLGEEDAHLGPAARAALGILLEGNEWAWWDDPSKAGMSLERAVPKSGPAKWGGDSSVMDATQWVDPLRAAAIGRAFEALDRRGPPRIKVVRAVWDWTGGPSVVDAVTSELSQLVGPGHVFPEWEGRAKPRRPVSTMSERGLCVVTSPSLPPKTLREEAQQFFEWVPDSRIADLVVAESVEALRTTESAQVVVLYGERTINALTKVGSLRRQLGAQCVIHVEANVSQIEDWLQLLISSWTRSKQTFAKAVEVVTAESGIRVRILSSTQSFLFGSGSFQRLHTSTNAVFQERLPSMRGEVPPKEISSSAGVASSARSSKDEAEELLGFEKEKTVGSAVGAVPPRLGPQRGDQRPKVVRPSPPIERVLNARARQGSVDIFTWPPKAVVDIEVDIRIKTPLNDRRLSFPEDRIEWESERKVLQVHLLEFGRPPITQEINLPRTGASTIARFSREPADGSIDLRLLVSDGARILQTARLQSMPGESIKFFIENIVTPVHHEKAGFDLALLVNDSLGNQPSMTVITGDGQSFLSPLSENDTQIARSALLTVLQEAVVNPTAPFEPLMLRLANRGSSLLKSLRSMVPNWPGTVDRVQLVAQSDAFFPIEYLYEGTMPESPKAGLCPERVGCLNVGKAIADCGIRAAGEKLCPMGFWGISGTIERHSWRAGQEVRIWGAPGSGKSGRLQIDDLSRIAFAASDKADEFNELEVLPHEVVRIANIEKSLSVKRTLDWPEWKAKIAKDAPSLLLLLVHMEDEAVYVGEDLGLNLSGITESHVGKAPIVVAIGCSTGHGEIPGSSLPAVLQRCGARVVVAAMTSVLGRHANRAARDLSKSLHEAAKSPTPVYVGQIVSELRRKLLSEELALGLAIVAFGDADIALGKA